MIFDFETILTLPELEKALSLNSEEIDGLIARGLPFINAGGKKLFLMGSVRIFFGRHEVVKGEKNG